MFWETFLHYGIGDSEIQIPEFAITRCDHLSRVGGGVCNYLRNSVIFLHVLTIQTLSVSY